jgi:hypothetical protein
MPHLELFNLWASAIALLSKQRHRLSGTICDHSQAKGKVTDKGWGSLIHTITETQFSF